MPPSPPRTKLAPLPSHTVGIGDALADSAPLASLARRMRASQARLDAILPLLPVAMRASVRAGPIDDDSCSLLVGSNAVAAKLRQMLPGLQAHLRSQGLGEPALRVKLLGPA